MSTISLRCEPTDDRRDAAAVSSKRVGALSEVELDAIVGAGGPNSGGVGSGGGSGGSRSSLPRLG